LAIFIICYLFNFTIYLLLINQLYETKVFISIFFLGMKLVGAQENSYKPNKDTLVVGYNINAPFIYKKNDKINGINYIMWKK